MTHHHEHEHGHRHHDHMHNDEHHAHCDHGSHNHHDHGHCDHEHHEQRAAGEMSFEKKMATLLDHWLKHNADHAGNYRQWAQKAYENHMEDVGKILDELAVMTMDMNTKLEAAAVAAKKSCK